MEEAHEEEVAQLPPLPPVDYEIAHEVEQEDLKLKKRKKAKKDKKERGDVDDDEALSERKPLDDIDLARIVVEEEAERRKEKKKRAKKEAKRREEADEADGRGTLIIMSVNLIQNLTLLYSLDGDIGMKNPSRREDARESSDEDVKREDMARMLAEAAAERTMRRKSKKEAKRREREREEEEGGHYVNLGRSRVFVRDNSVRTTEV